MTFLPVHLIHSLPLFSSLLKLPGQVQTVLLLQQYLWEERCEEMHANFAVAQAAQKNGELTFSSDLNKLSQLIED